MARHLHLDPFCGIAESQWLGLLVDLRASPELIDDVTEVLEVDAGIDVEQRQVDGIQAYQVVIRADNDEPRGYVSMRTQIAEAGLPERPAAHALAVLDKLAGAIAVEQGVEPVAVKVASAAQAMVYILGICLMIEDLGVESLSSGPVATGSGVDVEGQPLMSPVSGRLLRDFEPYPGEERIDLAPVLGAALLAGLCQPARIHPGMLLDRYGHGTGPGMTLRTPHVLRGYIGERLSPLVQLEVTASDSPQQLAYALERLSQAGAIEAWIEPVGTREFHTVARLVALAERKDEAEVRTALLRETSAISVRAILVELTEAFHRTQKVNTAFGEVPVHRKADWLTPDHETCATLAREHGVPIHRIFDAAKHAARRADPRAEQTRGAPPPATPGSAAPPGPAGPVPPPAPSPSEPTVPVPGGPPSADGE